MRFGEVRKREAGGGRMGWWREEKGKKEGGGKVGGVRGKLGRGRTKGGG